MNNIVAFLALSLSVAACTAADPSDGASASVAASASSGAGVGGGDGTSSSASSASGAGGRCACTDEDGECRSGYDLAACGSDGEECHVCSFGQTCNFGKCASVNSICIKVMIDAGTVGGDCSKDSECSAKEWCSDHCCDPVGGACFVVGKCLPRLAKGAHCDHVGGGRDCLSGVCNTDGDTCE